MRRFNNLTFREPADISETGCSPRFSEAGKEGGVLIFLPEEGYLYSHVHSVRCTVEEIEKQGRDRYLPSNRYLARLPALYTLPRSGPLPDPAAPTYSSWVV